MRGIYRTDIESIMESNLRDNNVDFVYQFPIRGSYILDFAIPDLKIDIECDGQHWHNGREVYDHRRNCFLKRRGWVVLRFTDLEIKNDIGKCIEKIKETIYKVKNNGHKN